MLMFCHMCSIIQFCWLLWIEGGIGKQYVSCFIQPVSSYRKTMAEGDAVVLAHQQKPAWGQLMDFVPSAVIPAHQSLICLSSCWLAYGSTGNHMKEMTIGDLTVPYKLYKCKISCNAQRCPAMLRLLQPRVDQVPLLQAIGISPYAVWKSQTWHVESHSSAFLEPHACLQFKTPSDLVAREHDMLEGAGMLVHARKRMVKLPTSVRQTLTNQTQALVTQSTRGIAAAVGAEQGAAAVPAVPGGPLEHHRRHPPGPGAPPGVREVRRRPGLRARRGRAPAQARGGRGGGRAGQGPGEVRRMGEAAARGIRRRRASRRSCRRPGHAR